MCWMIPHAKLLVDQFCHSLRRPDVSSKSRGLCPSLQQRGKLRQLVLAESGLGSVSDVPLSSLFSLLSPHLHPLAHCPLRHSQCLRNVFLAPSLLRQFPRSASAPLFPISSVFVCFSHASSLPYFSKLGRSQ